MLERITNFHSFDVAATFPLAEYSRALERELHRLQAMVDQLVRALLREHAESHGTMAIILYDRCVTLLGGKAEVVDPEQQKEQLCSAIRERLQSGKFVEGCEAAIRGIHQFPEEDRFVRCLVDAYIARDSQGEGQLFRNSFPLLCRYFAQQSCYPRIGLTRADALQIMMDLFDYGMRASLCLLTLFTEFFSRMPMGQEMIAVSTSFFEQKAALVEQCLHAIKDEESVLERAFAAPQIREEHFFSDLQRRLLQLSCELVGGQEASVPIGMKKYVEALCSLLSCFVARLEPNEGVQALLIEVRRRLEASLSQVNAAVRRVFHDGAQPGLRAVAERHRSRIATQLQEAKPSVEGEAKPLVKEKDAKPSVEEEPSVAEWTRRQNLINAITHLFVPRHEQDRVIGYLETHGVSLDRLFATDLVESMPEVRGAASAEGLSQRGIVTISDLRAYIDNPI